MTDPIPTYVPKLSPTIRPLGSATYGLTISEPNGTLRKLILNADQIAALGMDIDRIRLVEGSLYKAAIEAAKAAASSG